jgi:phosphatidylglycerol:prolipoprotein diacylglycerol transferase
VLICFIYRKKKFNGQMALTYFAWYGFGRMFIEGLRTDSLYVGPFRISQVVGAVCFLAGGALMIAGFVLAKKGKLDKWLTVRWAEPVPAEGEAVSETASEAEEIPADETPCETDAPSEEETPVSNNTDAE